MGQANVLIDNTGTACVADFGLMIMADLGTILLSETAVSSGGTLYRMSPELLYPSRFGSNGRPTHESDCYALGMVVYEVGWLYSSRRPLTHASQVLTGLQPFRHLHDYTAVAVALEGKRPEKPLDAESLGFSHTLWSLVELCWSEPSSARPTAQRLLDYLSAVSPEWVPSPVYPVNEADASHTADSDSSGSLRTSLANIVGEV